MTLNELAEGILEMVPPHWRFRPEDSAPIQRHKDFLLSLADGLVQGFYDTLFAYPHTRAGGWGGGGEAAEVLDQIAAPQVG